MSISYTATTWVSGTTPLSAANMNNIESGISQATTTINSILTGYLQLGNTTNTKIYIQSTQPSSPNTNDLWVDTSTSLG